MHEKRNPLTEGEKKAPLKPCGRHIDMKPSEELLKFNAKNKMLPHATKYHKRAPTSLSNNIYGFEKENVKQQLSDKTFGSLKKKGGWNKENDAKQAIQYESAPKYREI